MRQSWNACNGWVKRGKISEGEKHMFVYMYVFIYEEVSDMIFKSLRELRRHQNSMANELLQDSNVANFWSFLLGVSKYWVLGIRFSNRLSYLCNIYPGCMELICKDKTNVKMMIMWSTWFQKIPYTLYFLLNTKDKTISIWQWYEDVILENT